ncbi:uncharacterized protein LOC131674695 [Phymastichus coffea]|uniref:uncharacterized protein LOC131674695 n=1 Tax=Phymastichus coffea TaxID=108790 RepID=UPI00273C3A63|nr:uncharacterized protein LOC131674695 [Phymastichus coffea]
MVGTPPPGNQAVLDTQTLTDQLRQLQVQQQQILASNQAMTNRCKLPDFWDFSPETWFVQVESLFDCYNVQDDSRRYNLVVAALKPDVLKELLDVTSNPPTDGKYALIKARIVERFAKTTDERLRMLFSGINTAGKKPSQLLWEMRTLAGANMADSALKVKWLDLLPGSSLAVLSVLDGTTLDEIAKAADRMFDLVPVSQAAATTTSLSVAALHPSSSRNNSPHRSDSSLAKEMANITAVMTQLLATTKLVLDAIAQRPNSGRGRSRSRGGPSSRGQSPASQSGYCYYHQRFGAEAVKCTSSCTFQKN